MAATRSRHVLIGGSFACDAALAQPLEILLDEVVKPGNAVSVEWLGYGTAADLSSLSEQLQRTRVDLVVLLVRLSDLQAAHPELQHAEGGVLADWAAQLEAYDQQTDVQTPPLIILFCPSPPLDRAPTLAKEEAALAHRIQSLQRVSCRASSELLVHFGDQRQDGSDWYSALNDKREHAPFTQSMLNAVALGCARQICRLVKPKHEQKKVIVLDCDNTLWGGSVADLGPQGVELSDRFLALQRFAVEQQRRGVLLCLCSKNIVADVDAVFATRAGDMVLQKSEHIVLSKVNWLPKSQNLREIAQELALGLDSFVFVDDNAVECHEVAGALPMVSVVRLPDDFGAAFLATQWVFDAPLDHRASDEDAARTKMYQQNAQRHELERQAGGSQAAFLSSLSVRILCERVDDETSAAFERVLQLHQRTNTFNVATSFSRALTSDALADYVAERDTHSVLASTVTDRYGHYGLVCATLFRVTEDKSTIVVDSFIMSCRALNRGVEHAMVKRIADAAYACGAQEIRVSWEATVRNEPVRVFFASLSFTSFRAAACDALAIDKKADKIQQSAASNGVWTMRTQDALGISFLKEVTDREAALAEVRSTAVALSWRQRVNEWMRRLLAAFIRFVKRCRPLPWVFRLLSWWSKRSKTTSRLSPAVFYEQEALNAFIDSRWRPTEATREAAPPPSTSNDLDEDAAHETDESFRLRARHQTKLLLLDHVSADTPRVVWAPQRGDDIRLAADEDEAGRVTVATDQLQQFHRPCRTPACSTPVYWENQCAFQRCRTCCYRVQRLLARATDERVHAKAREHAQRSLAADFNVTMEDTEAKEEWCGAHKNERRRK